MMGGSPGARLGDPKRRRRLFRRSVAGQAHEASLDHYVLGMPSPQNAIDAMPGWTGAMPP